MVLVGGGTVGTRKARLLLRAGASLTVVSPTISDELERMLTEHFGAWRQARYSEVELQGKTLVVAATARQSDERTDLSRCHGSINPRQRG